MARATLPTVLTPGADSDLTPSDLGTAAIIQANGAQFSWSASREQLIYIFNPDASAHTITIASVADEQGRTGDVAQLVAAGAQMIFGPFGSEGWRQSVDGMIYVDSDSDLVEAAVIEYVPN